MPRPGVPAVPKADRDDPRACREVDDRPAAFADEVPYVEFKSIAGRRTLETCNAGRLQTDGESER